LFRVGLGVQPILQSRVHTQTDTYAFLVRYTGQLTPQELGDVGADLINETGKVLPLSWESGFLSKKHEYVRVWALASPPTNRATFRLRLRLQNTEASLAEVKIGRL